MSSLPASLVARIAHLSKQPTQQLIRVILQHEFATVLQSDIASIDSEISNALQSGHGIKRELSPTPPLPSASTTATTATTVTNTMALEPVQKKPKVTKPFDFWSYPQRHIALRFLYIGTDYYGYASQPNTALQQRARDQPRNRALQQQLANSAEDSELVTVEQALFKVLKQTKLIDGEGDCRYQRCGRTDKGVHATQQTVTLWLRSKVRHGVGCVPQSLIDARNDADIKDKLRHHATTTTGTDTNASATSDTAEEFDYLSLLNKYLPCTIRVTAYSPVPLDFDARFSCRSRTYHYLFYDDGMDIDTMRAAARLMVGTHDFRNFCKIDAVNVKHFIRTINDIRIEPFKPVTSDSSSVIGSSDSLYTLIIDGVGFLYHQVRCMSAILFAIGLHEESVDVVNKLLDVDAVKNRPAYNMASERGLILHETGYAAPYDNAVQWSQYPTPALSLAAQTAVLNDLHCQWREKTLYAAVVEKMMCSVKSNIDLLTQHRRQPVVDFNTRWPRQLDSRRLDTDDDGGSISRRVEGVNGTQRIRMSLLDDRNKIRHDSFEQKLAKLKPKERQRRDEAERLRREYDSKQRQSQARAKQSGGDGSARMEDNAASDDTEASKPVTASSAP